MITDLGYDRLQSKASGGGAASSKLRVEEQQIKRAKRSYRRKDRTKYRDNGCREFTIVSVVLYVIGSRNDRDEVSLNIIIPVLVNSST